MARAGLLLCLLLSQGIFAVQDTWDQGRHGRRHQWRERDYHSDYWHVEENATAYYPDLTVRQLLDFKLAHPKPAGLLTLGSGSPVDIRDQVGVNSDLFKHEYFFDVQSHLDGETVQPRIVQVKGFGVWGHFEVTHDISKYTSADVFNGVGKKTTTFARFAVGSIGNGGTDLGRDIKDMAVKLYTKDGILDVLSLQTPVFAFKDPSQFPDFVHAFDRRNVKTNIRDYNTIIDLIVLRPYATAFLLYLFSDFGVPKGWRHSNYFPIHTYELSNKHGERYYVRFNWRTEQGFDFLTDEEIALIADPDYFIRDMYNAVENGTYPSWRLEMDVLSLHDIQTVDFNPFDVTLLWKNGTYHTETIGRLTLTELPENQFRDTEQATFDPSSLVPGIPGPVDTLFRGRKFAYRDTQNYRVGRNHLKVGVNSPDYQKRYVRDGHAPVLDNGKDSPNYYPNSFNGPIPYVDDRRPKEELQILESNAVDLQEAANIYNIYLDEGGKQRLAETIAQVLVACIESVQTRFIKLLYLVSPDLAVRTEAALEVKLANRAGISQSRRLQPWH